MNRSYLFFLNGTLWTFFFQGYQKYFDLLHFRDDGYHHVIAF